MCCSSVKGVRWFFSSNQERVRSIVVTWAFQEFPSFFPSFFAFDQTKQVFGNCCVGKATGVFWNQALSCRGYFCHTSKGFSLLYPTVHSYAAAKMNALNASILYKKVRSKRSTVLQPCLSQSGLGAWSFRPGVAVSHLRFMTTRLRLAWLLLGHGCTIWVLMLCRRLEDACVLFGHT